MELKSDWIYIEDELPPYYKPVWVELTTGKTEIVWRASDGEYDMYTVFGTDQVYYRCDIAFWDKNSLIKS